MDRRTRIDVEPKFTRGEKCLFLHLVLTFVLIIILILIYAIHLYLVNHKRYGIFSTRSSVSELKDASENVELLVGYIFLNLTTSVRFICNTLLLQPRWSLCTAHCVAIRNIPGLRHLSHVWGLGYKINTKDRSSKKMFIVWTSPAERVKWCSSLVFVTQVGTSLSSDLQSSIFVTGIKNAIVHPFFNRHSFENNIGLIEHAVSAPLFGYTALNTGAVFVSSLNRKNMVIVGWNHSNKSSDDSDFNSTISYDLEQIISPKCKESLAPVTTLRNYEFCVALKKRRGQTLGYGSAVFHNSKLSGLFSWGERMQKVLPLVIINVTLFQDWIASTTF